MRKLGAVAVVVGLVAAAALGLSSCGSSGSSGKEGGVLKVGYSGAPDYLDPQLSYETEGWTAMWNSYVPLLTYAHASGQAGGEVVPGLAKSLPKITDRGKTYTLELRKGLKYSNGKPVMASDFTYAVERMFRLNSGGLPFFTSIIGAEKFLETKKGGIPGIETNDKTGKIVIRLERPRGTFSNELGLMFTAPVPQGTPNKNLSTEPPPATGPYVITKADPSTGFTEERNPQWAKNNAKLMPEWPSGHIDKFDVSYNRNGSTQVNEVEQGKSNWMQASIPTDRLSEVKSKFEGNQFRPEPTISTYYFWMNTTKPPFDDLKVRQAVNYAVDTGALERIYAGQQKATHQILPPGMPGYKKFDLYPHNMAKAKELMEEANPSDRSITVWTDDESPNDEVGAYYEDVLKKLGFKTELKVISASDYFTVIGNLSTPNLDTGFLDWLEDYPHPNDFFQPLLAGESILQTNNGNAAQIDVPRLNKKIASLSEEKLGPKQEAEYAAMDREYMELAPWVPYGTRTLSTFVSSDVNLESIIYNPTFGQDLTSFEFK
jgi:peptide/nickel transport system substrate-binding protein